MSRQTIVTQSGESSKVSSPRNDALSPAFFSGDVELEDAIQDSETETNNIKQLLNEFKGLYEQRLRCLELDSCATQGELLQRKVNFLQSYVNDLADQNQVLVQTIEDLQREADDKVFSWGMKLRSSDRSFKDLNQQRTQLKPSSCDLCSEKKRSEVSKVDLKTPMLDKLVGPAAHVTRSTSSLVQMAPELEDLKIQLQMKDAVISDQEKELQENSQQNQKVLERSERLLHLQSELSCLQRLQKDNMKEIAEKDVCITKLQATIQLLQEERGDTHAQLSKLRVKATALQEELKRKEEEWRQREAELKYEKEHQQAEERKRCEQGKREEWVKTVEEEKKREEEWEAHAEAVKKWAEEAAILNSEIKEREDRVRHLCDDVASLRATQDCLKRTLAQREKHTQQLVQDNTQLKESLASLQSILQTSECMLSDISKSLDQANTTLNTERQQRQQIQDQLHHAHKEMERLQQEVTHVRLTAEKKWVKIASQNCLRKWTTSAFVQSSATSRAHPRRSTRTYRQQEGCLFLQHHEEIRKREIKMCALVKELSESKEQHSECQNELLRRETASEKLCEERDELRAKMEDRARECVHLNQTKERLEADLALSHEKLQTLHLEVRSRDQLILQLRAEMKAAEQKHERTQEQVAELEVEVRHLKRKVKGYQGEASQLSEKVRDGDRLKDQKEKEQQQLRDQLCISQQQVEAFKGKLKRQEADMELLHQQLKGAKEELKDASLQAQEQKETAAIFRQKYTAAIEKVHRVQGQVELLGEELQYSQQQLKESQLATHSVKEELSEMMQRFQEKVSQWENSQEALDQLTDELQANQNLLREGQQKVDNLQGLMGSLQDKKLMLECDLRLYQQSHSHSDKEYVSLLRHRQQLQKRCTEQNERLAECEKSILQMKSELERQTQEKLGLKQSLVAYHHAHMSDRSQLEQEVLRLKKEVTHSEIELADTQKVHVALLRQSEEELKEARQEAARRSSEVDVQRGEVHRLQEELQKEREEMRSAIRQKQSLSGHIRQLSQELEELRSQYQVTVQELAARAEEARRMEGCLNEGKLAEGKIRSMAVRLETEVAELRRNLQQAVDHKLKAERGKREAQDQVDALRLELEATRSDNADLRHESQQVMTNVSQWITEQKASNQSLTAQMKAQKKVLLIITEEKEHLQEANDTLKAEVKRLKEVADERERDTERFKAQIQDRGIRQEERIMGKQACVAQNLSKIEDMQTRLRRNLEAIGMLNQQLNALSGENKRLRRQLEEERSVRLLTPPPTTQQGSSVHLPFSLFARPPPPSTSLPSSLRLRHPMSLDAATGGIDGILTQAKLSRSGLKRPVESQASGEAFWIRPTVSLEDVQSGGGKPGSDQMKPPEDFDLS